MTGLRVRRIALPLAFAAFCLAAWELVLRWVAVSTMIIVPPSAIWATLLRALPILTPHLLLTAENTVEGFLLATLLGLGLGTAITLSARVRQALYPNIVLFQLIPKAAVAPLFIVWLGVGSPSRLAFCVFMSFFPIAVATAAGLVAASPDAVRLCRSLTASTWQTFLSVRFPFAIPQIFAGLKVGITMAMIGMIVSEFVTAQDGLGYVVMFASSAGDAALLYTALVLLCGLGLLLYGAIALAERAAQRWYGAPFAAGGFV